MARCQIFRLAVRVPRSACHFLLLFALTADLPGGGTPFGLSFAAGKSGGLESPIPGGTESRGMPRGLLRLQVSPGQERGTLPSCGVTQPQHCCPKCMQTPRLPSRLGRVCCSGWGCPGTTCGQSPLERLRWHARLVNLCSHLPWQGSP